VCAENKKIADAPVHNYTVNMVTSMYEKGDKNTGRTGVPIIELMPAPVKSDDTFEHERN
jgi:hypothetical protein